LKQCATSCCGGSGRGRLFSGGCLLPGTAPLLHQQGFEAVGGTAESFAAFLRTELVKWGKLIKQANIRPE